MSKNIKAVLIFVSLLLIVFSVFGCNKTQPFDTAIPADATWIDHKDSKNYSLSGSVKVVGKENSKLEDSYIKYDIIVEKIGLEPAEIIITAYLDDDFLAFYPNQAFLVFGTDIDMPVKLTEDVRKTFVGKTTLISIEELSDTRKERLREIILGSDVKVKISDGDTSEYLVLPAEDIEFDVSVLEEDS